MADYQISLSAKKTACDSAWRLFYDAHPWRAAAAQLIAQTRSACQQPLIVDAGERFAGLHLTITIDVDRVSPLVRDLRFVAMALGVGADVPPEVDANLRMSTSDMTSTLLGDWLIRVPGGIFAPVAELVSIPSMTWSDSDRPEHVRNVPKAIEEWNRLVRKDEERALFFPLAGELWFDLRDASIPAIDFGGGASFSMDLQYLHTVPNIGRAIDDAVGVDPDGVSLVELAGERRFVPLMIGQALNWVRKERRRKKIA